MIKSIDPQEYKQFLEATKTLPYKARLVLSSPYLSFLRNSTQRYRINASIKYYNDELEERRRNHSVDADLHSIFTSFQQRDPDAKEDPDTLFGEGLEAFITEGLEQPFDLITPLLLSFLLQCEAPGEVTKREFCEGFFIYGCHTLPTMRSFVKTAFYDLLHDPTLFKELYLWTFEFAKHDKSQRSVDFKEGRLFWKIILPRFPSFSTYPDFIEFMNRKKPPVISRDLWHNLYPFTTAMKDDYVNNFNLDEDDGWNTTLDQFAMYMIEKTLDKDEQ